jgi:hypothetical protein
MHWIKILFLLFLPASLSATPQSHHPKPNTFLMSTGTLTRQQLTGYLLKYNEELRPSFARFIATLYIQESAREGVNHDVAFAQMILETAFLKYGGQVHPSQNNFCGLGALDDGRAGASFPTPREGVRAHIQHLKAYGSTLPLRQENVDPRFHLVTRGSVLTIQGLTGRWATDPNYGPKIQRIMQNIRSHQDNPAITMETTPRP